MGCFVGRELVAPDPGASLLAKAPYGFLAHQSDSSIELGKQQEALGKQQEELGAKMEQVRVNVPDMTAPLDKLKAKLQKLELHDMPEGAKIYGEARVPALFSRSRQAKIEPRGA